MASNVRFWHKGLSGGSNPVLDVIEINGTANSSAIEEIPLDTYYENFFSGIIYESSQIGKSGEIQKLQFYNINKSWPGSYYLQRLKVFLFHLPLNVTEFPTTVNNNFATSLPTMTNYTQVFGNTSLGSPANLTGTNYIDATGGTQLAPFQYDMNYNLGIKFECRQDPAYQSPSYNAPEWAYLSTSRQNKSCYGHGGSFYPSTGSSFAFQQRVKIDVYG